eukprot:jgi/Tetstr1/420345/TSEL_011465.t1
MRSAGVELLIVEDDTVQAKVLTRLLSREGFSVLAVPSGEAALELLQGRDATGVDFPSIILHDYYICNGVAGSVSVRSIRNSFPDAVMPIIMVTSEVSEEVLCESLSAGCNDYICKPLKRNSLLARIHVQLELLYFWRLEVSSRKSEALLLEILPPSVITRYRQGRRVIDALPEISVLFTEIVDFPSVQQSLGVIGTIALLDSMFCLFDDLTDKHAVYKIESVGDSYMAMAGHDKASATDHANRLVAFASDLVRELPAVIPELSPKLQIRVGIHTGPAYSGIVGHKCPRYCLFGDTINVASRMKSTSFPQCVQISNATYLKLRGLPSSDTSEAVMGVSRPPPLAPEEFYDLGEREIKGKGLMQTWLLANPGNARAENASMARR